MGCDCGSGAGPSQKYELTVHKPDGSTEAPRVFLTETEARVALATSGGNGVIRTVA